MNDANVKRSGGLKKLGAKLMGNNFLLVITIVLIVVMYAIGCVVYADKNFTRLQVFLNLFIDNAGLIVAGVGMTIVLITGGIDISIGSVVGVTCMMLAYSMEIWGWNAWMSILFVLCFGLVFGTVQGFLVSYLKIQPFIVTLAGMFFARGLTAVISTDPISITNDTFRALATTRINFPFGGYENRNGEIVMPYVYPSVILALLVLAAAFIMLRYTKFGRSIYAIGGNEQSALLMGLNVRAIKMKVYVLNGFLASLAGATFCLNSLGGFVEQARGFEMEAIATSVIGGTLLSGGVGNVIGTLFGVLIKATIEKFISFDGTLNSWWTKIVIAILLAFFIILQSVFARIREKSD